MPDTKSLRGRIKSVDSTLHLTSAMGLVASSKMRRANEAMGKARAYADAVEKMAKALTALKECQKSPYMATRSGGRTRLIVIAGDRGLCGGYNVNVFKLAKSLEGADVIPVGKRAFDRYGKEYFSSESFSPQDGYRMAETLCDDFVRGEYDRLGIVRTNYVSMLTQTAVIEWILPLEKGEEERAVGAIFEPNEAEILAAVAKEYVAGKIMRAVRESFASEVAARRTAMDSAGKNAREMIERLSLEYNRARQGAITQEITEIVAGSGG